MPAKIVPGRNALRSISGRKAGEEHARTQCPLCGEDLQSHSANVVQSHFVQSVFASQRPVTASSGKNNRKTKLMQNIRAIALRAVSSASREKSRCTLQRAVLGPSSQTMNPSFGRAVAS